ncbi:hypothetical protein M409DRAFT_28727 [Zasmidium cellare ATCC 36951]|uniref:NTF2-like domain-containing protein n=1 Tax=Zasmidium cellare ATCC 36951 TaxID=1080233 RepID=A0A6A6C3H9_ZASCE|nr:uncharacterized protein M409DRAFT_28727 [Zasmidium cellare ATCC 36951]KAF2160848.1 hypothetical protein M409DRAFT_28727 [Zasmidium cellare ATCC 36951]
MFSRAIAIVSLLSFSLQSVTATCLLDNNAQKVAQNYATLFSNYSPQFADQVLTKDVIDQSDSVNWLITNGTNACSPLLGATTFNGREAFKAGQSTQPNMPFTILNVYHDCTNVFVRWNFDVKPQQVQGISVLGTKLNTDLTKLLTQPYLIKTVYAEFNVGAFIVNLGYYQGTKPSTCKRDVLGVEAVPFTA